MPGRILSLSLLCGLPLALSCSAPPPLLEGDDDRPSVIFLLVDTLRADHLGAFGFDGPISPRLDALAAESIVFERCYAQAPWTPPSVGTLFTSLYPQVHGLNHFENHSFKDPDAGELRASVLPDAAVTLAETLRDAGFATAGFVGNPWLEARLGLGQGFDLWDDSELSKRTPAQMLTVPARQWLESDGYREPFFLYMHFMDVHEPYDAAEAEYEAVRPSIREDRALEPDEMPEPRMEVPAPWASDEQRASLAYWRTRYAAGVRTLDNRLERLLDHFRTSGLLDRSWLIVAADHGEELFEHRGWGHGESLHDHQLRVPLFARPPGGLAEARRVEHPIGMVDLMPTLLALLDVEPPGTMQGENRSLLFERDVEPETPPLLFATAVVDEPRTFSIVRDRYKLILKEDDRVELYDRVEDPGETNDVASERPEVVTLLREQLEHHIEASMAGGPLERQTETIPPELRERLEALGYLQ